MPVFIREVISEVVVDNPNAGNQSQPSRNQGAAEADIDAIVRRATERVLEQLRREWER